MSGFITREFYDPSADKGYWSPSTSQSNFCEHDYGTSFYIVEFINTISNAAYVYFALRPQAIISSPVGKGNQQGRRTDSVVWDVHTFGLLSVGLSSAYYHATLQYLPQILDQSSMYVLATGFCWDLLTTSYRSDGLTWTVAKHSRREYAAIITIILVTVTILSQVTGYLLLHSITFALMLIFSGLKLMGLLRSPVNSNSKQYWWRFGKAYLLLNLGFACWLIDCDPGYCAALRNFRASIEGSLGVTGKVLGYFTELHGWWHILTGAAAAEWISLIREITRPRLVSRGKHE